MLYCNKQSMKPIPIPWRDLESIHRSSKSLPDNTKDGTGQKSNDLDGGTLPKMRLTATNWAQGTTVGPSRQPAYIAS